MDWATFLRCLQHNIAIVVRQQKNRLNFRCSARRSLYSFVSHLQRASPWVKSSTLPQRAHLPFGKKKKPICSVVRFHPAAGWPDAKCILVMDSTCQPTSSCIDPLKCSSCFFLFLDMGDDEACHLHHVTRPSITPGRLHVNKRIPLSSPPLPARLQMCISTLDNSVFYFCIHAWVQGCACMHNS